MSPTPREPPDVSSPFLRACQRLRLEPRPTAQATVTPVTESPAGETGELPMTAVTTTLRSVPFRNVTHVRQTDSGKVVSLYHPLGWCVLPAIRPSILPERHPRGTTNLRLRTPPPAGTTDWWDYVKDDGNKCDITRPAILSRLFNSCRHSTRSTPPTDTDWCKFPFLNDLKEEKSHRRRGHRLAVTTLSFAHAAAEGRYAKEVPADDKT
jgi:hypothetical protein